MSWLDGSTTLFSLSMVGLPVELLDEILSLAVALGTISLNEATRICRRWRSFQKHLFKTVKLDPFDKNTLDLNDHSHLIPYIEELRVGGVIRRSHFSCPSNFNYDLSASFTKFLCNITHPLSMIFCDSRIQWAKVSSSSIGAFLTVFRRDTFRSLEVSVHKPLPSWMLLQGLCVASELVVHYIGRILPPESPELLPYQCSLTHLVLFGNAAVKRTAEFCLEQRDLAKILLQHVVYLVLEYGETHAAFGPAISPYAEMLVVFLGPQLEELDIRVRSFSTPLHISESALRHLKALQHFSIYFMGCSADNTDTLLSVMEFMKTALGNIPSSSLIRSLSLKVKDRRELDPAADFCESNYHKLLQYICKQLSCAKKWPRLTSSNILVDVYDDNFTTPIRKRVTVNTGTTSLEIVSLFHVNISKAENFSSLAIPQIG